MNRTPRHRPEPNDDPPDRLDPRRAERLAAALDAEGTDKDAVDADLAPLVAAAASLRGAIPPAPARLRGRVRATAEGLAAGEEARDGARSAPGAAGSPAPDVRRSRRRRWLRAIAAVAAGIVMMRTLDIVAANARPGSALGRLHAAVLRFDAAVLDAFVGDRDGDRAGAPARAGDPPPTAAAGPAVAARGDGLAGSGAGRSGSGQPDGARTAAGRVDAAAAGAFLTGSPRPTEGGTGPATPTRRTPDPLASATQAEVSAWAPPPPSPARAPRRTDPPSAPTVDPASPSPPPPPTATPSAPTSTPPSPTTPPRQPPQQPPTVPTATATPPSGPPSTCAGIVRGTVRSQLRQVVANALVVAATTASNAPAEATSGQDGQYALTRLCPFGPYAITVRAVDGVAVAASTTVTVSLAAGDPARLGVDLVVTLANPARPAPATVAGPTATVPPTAGPTSSPPAAAPAAAPYVDGGDGGRGGGRRGAG